MAESKKQECEKQEQREKQVDEKLSKLQESTEDDKDVGNKVANTSQETAGLFGEPQRSIPLIDEGKDKKN